MSTVSEFISNLRGKLAPKGTQDITRLALGNYGYVSHDLVVTAIDQLENKMILGGLQGEATPLEKLGILLLTETT